MTVASEARTQALGLATQLIEAASTIEGGDPTALPVIQAVTRAQSLLSQADSLLDAGNVPSDVEATLNTALFRAQAAVGSLRASRADPARARRIREEQAAEAEMSREDGEAPVGVTPQTGTPTPQGWQGEWENKTFRAPGGTYAQITQWLAEPNVPWYQQRWLYVTGALSLSAAAYFYWKEQQQ